MRLGVHAAGSHSVVGELICYRDASKPRPDLSELSLCHQPNVFPLLLKSGLSLANLSAVKVLFISAPEHGLTEVSPKETVPSSNMQSEN